MADAIPVIDLLEYPKNSSELMKASEEWGCFRIVNFESILPVSLMYEMKAVVATLLELPLEVKQNNIDAIVGSGYARPGQLNPIHEGFGLYDIASSEAVDAFCTQLDATPQQRINKYSFTPETIGSDGLRIHTDNGFLTIVQDDEQFAGLEVMRKSGEFVAFEPCPGTLLLVNFGDIATAWSNGRFYNVKQRVVSKKLE